MTDNVTLTEKLTEFDDPSSLLIISELDDKLQMAKGSGEAVRHSHPDSDDSEHGRC